MTDSKKIDLILSKVDTMISKIEDHDKKIDSMDKRIDSMDKRIDSMDKRIDSMDKRIASIDNSVKDIKLTLENEIRPSIIRVAEGHLDLSRNFQEAKKPNEEVEMLSIRVNLLEADVRAIKQKIS